MGLSTCPCGGFIALGLDASNRCDKCGKGPFDKIDAPQPSASEHELREKLRLSLRKSCHESYVCCDDIDRMTDAALAVVAPKSDLSARLQEVRAERDLAVARAAKAEEALLIVKEYPHAQGEAQWDTMWAEIAAALESTDAKGDISEAT